MYMNMAGGGPASRQFSLRTTTTLGISSPSGSTYRVGTRVAVVGLREPSGIDGVCLNAIEATRYEKDAESSRASGNGGRRVHHGEREVAELQRTFVDEKVAARLGYGEAPAIYDRRIRHDGGCAAEVGVRGELDGRRAVREGRFQLAAVADDERRRRADQGQ